MRTRAPGAVVTELTGGETVFPGRGIPGRTSAARPWREAVGLGNADDGSKRGARQDGGVALVVVAYGGGANLPKAPSCAAHEVEEKGQTLHAT